jgi:hypothetical protein
MRFVTPARTWFEASTVAFGVKVGPRGIHRLAAWGNKADLTPAGFLLRGLMYAPMGPRVSSPPLWSSLS